MAIAADADIELKNSYVDERVESLLPLLESLAPFKPTERKKGRKGLNVGTGEEEYLKGWEALAVEEVIALKDKYPDPAPKEEDKMYRTATSQLSRYKKELRRKVKAGKLSDAAMAGAVNTIITHWGDTASLLFRQYKARSNQDQRDKVEARSSSEIRVELDLSLFIEQTHSVLSNLDGLKTRDWKQVSCALALATGRRMAEIHCSAQFRLINDYTVGFKGYLKGKSRKRDGKPISEHEFNIPTLIEAELVVAGLVWLTENGKRVEQPEVVNRKYSRYLSEEVKENWLVLGRDEMTYHKFRGAYFRACTVNAKVNPLDYMNYAREVLGDRDEDTIRHYQRFEIKPGSQTRI